ncbi:DUF881 domain-containing protein [Blastococcus xanthinilyticus]|uniref:Uncharacterized protein YlxW (UPF0749 family) n=1 Tax=Blastococcus xanthinilyticus TaxID=1564164 RepID=A0A5S5D4C3_9ACTN|nr:DUF881 domain-containing protein [Blastococcus xanthinilyticus]TYP90545.1 uncharacterized protein YlxW (UPF0749 family) [Blastococcus xanthinilyticus]
MERDPSDAGTAEPSPLPPGSEPDGPEPVEAETVTPDQVPADEVPAGQAPAGQTPTGQTPTGQTPTGQTPAGQTPAGEVPAGEASAEEPPAGAEEPTAEAPGAATAGTESGEPDEPSISTAASGSRNWSRPVAVLATAGLTVALGFALTTQIRSTAEPEDQVATREEDLVLILDEINAREETLRRQIGETRQTLEELSSGQQKAGSALEEARSRAEAIGVLAGTLPAAGPGVRVTVLDPDGAVPTSVILGAIQELRGAGAEAIEVDDVRIVASSAVTGSPGDLRINGQPLIAPYEFHAVGPPAAMDVALNVSGGVVDDIGRVGGKAQVQQDETIVVDALVG